jgi:hypothetical protein
MIPIALILLLIVILFSIAVVIGNPGVFDLSIFGAIIPVNTTGVYLTGAGAMLVLILALGLLRVGTRRSMARRKQVKALKQEANAGQPTAKPDTASPGSAARTGADSPATAPGTPAHTKSDEPAARHPDLPSNETADVSTTTSSAEREDLLAEVDETTRDDPPR